MLSEFTIGELRKLEQYMLEEPKRFNLSYWGVHIDPKLYDDESYEAKSNLTRMSGDTLLYSHISDMFKQKPPCGTMGCLAGNYLVMRELVKPSSYCDSTEVYTFAADTDQLAADALGLDRDQMRRLFYPNESRYHGWPAEWQEKLDATKPGTLEYAQVAVDRIEHFIATGGEE